MYIILYFQILIIQTLPILSLESLHIEKWRKKSWNWAVNAAAILATSHMRYRYHSYVWIRFSKEHVTYFFFNCCFLHRSFGLGWTHAIGKQCVLLLILQDIYFVVIWDQPGVCCTCVHLHIAWRPVWYRVIRRHNTTVLPAGTKNRTKLHASGILIKIRIKRWIQ